MTTDRYDRQKRFAPFGPDGQRALGSSAALLVGCGALGTVLAEILVRAGIGRLVLIDRDLVETSNLQRQTLYREEDARQSWPKAEAAALRLREINSEVTLEAHAIDLHAHNLPELAGGVDLLLDGTDNFHTRYLLNDFAVRENLPWIYGGAVADHGLQATILPGRTPCLRCLFPEPPPASRTATCDTAGVLAPASGIIASLQAMDALKILSGNASAVAAELVQIDLWDRRLVVVRTRRKPGCPCCQERRFPYLEENRGLTRAEVLCGRDSVQIHPAPSAIFDFDTLERRLADQAIACQRTRFWIRFEVQSLRCTAFPDGRLLIQGSADLASARSLYSRILGD